MPFSASVCSQLSRRVGGACSVCHAATTGPHSDPARSVNVGEGAHISGEKPAAARYDSALSEEYVSSAQNGIWVCRSCHKKIDDDAVRYTVAHLNQIKAEAETNADLAVGVAMPTDDPMRTLLSTVEGIASAHKAAVGAMQDADVRHVTDRIMSFPPETRLPHVGGYLLGISADLYGRLTNEEFVELFTRVLSVSTGVTTTLIRAGQRMVFEVAKEFRESVRPANSEITRLFAQTLSFAMLNRVYFAGLPDWAQKMQPNLVTYGRLTLREQLENNAPQAWEPLQRCLAGYDPKRHPPASDEEYRWRTAQVALDGATTREEFEARLLAAIDRYMPELQRRYDHFLQLLPVDVIVVCDPRGVWRNPDLLRRMHETTMQVAEIRAAVRSTPQATPAASGVTVPSADPGAKPR
jgi:hypothetical protein